MELGERAAGLVGEKATPAEMMGAQRESGEVVNKTAAARLGVRHGEVELGPEDDGDVCEIGLGDVVSASRGEERV